MPKICFKTQEGSERFVGNWWPELGGYTRFTHCTIPWAVAINVKFFLIQKCKKGPGQDLTSHSLFQLTPRLLPLGQPHKTTSRAAHTHRQHGRTQGLRVLLRPELNGLFHLIWGNSSYLIV